MFKHLTIFYIGFLCEDSLTSMTKLFCYSVELISAQCFRVGSILGGVSGMFAEGNAGASYVASIYTHSKIIDNITVLLVTDQKLIVFKGTTAKHGQTKETNKQQVDP